MDRDGQGYDIQAAFEAARTRVAYHKEGLQLDVASQLIEAMEKGGVSRSELARRLDVSPAYITKVLQGNANLTLTSLAKLAFALDLKWTCKLRPIRPCSMVKSDLAHASV